MDPTTDFIAGTVAGELECLRLLETESQSCVHHIFVLGAAALVVGYPFDTGRLVAFGRCMLLIPIFRSESSLSEP
jgi:hypothetical protein